MMKVPSVLIGNTRTFVWRERISEAWRCLDVDSFGRRRPGGIVSRDNGS